MRPRLLFIILIILSLVFGNCAVSQAAPADNTQYEEIPSGENLQDLTELAPSQDEENPAAQGQQGATDEDAFDNPAANQQDNIIEPSLDGNKKGGSGNVTLTFKDADIKTVLHTLSEKSGMNIVAGPDIDAKVTIKLTDVPWEKALNVILKTYGLAYERDGNIVRVVKVENLQEETLKTMVFKLKYAKAYETTLQSTGGSGSGENVKVPGLAETVKEMLSERGNVKYDRRTNTLIVTDVPTNLQAIEDVIRELDRPTPQILIEVKIVETTLAKGENLGIDWQAKIIAKGAKIPITFPFGNQFQHLGVLKNYMPIPEAVTKEITYDETTATQTIEQAISDFPTSGTISNDGTITPGTPSFPFTDASPFLFGTLDFSQFQAVLEILKERSDTNIVSNPRVTAMDNQRAIIHVGQTLNMPTFERNTDTGNMEITGYSRENEIQLGVTLIVTPHINGPEEVTLALTPSLSSLLRYDSLTPEIKAPVIQERTADTEVMVRSGQTVAIGGLVTERDIDSVNKIPILGDVPILGYLFKKTEKSTEKIDLIFFITVYVVDSSGQKIIIP